jgi:hypothetical protein
MDDVVQQCLGLIVLDNVDEVLWALNDTYFWLRGKMVAEESYRSEQVLQRFLDQVSQTLIRKEEYRRIIVEKEVRAPFRNREAIRRVIQPFFEKLGPEEGLVFLGRLTAGYALEIPEPMFRVAHTFLGLHKTPDIPPIEDHLPMTDEMILFAWQYFWFYTWLGY